MDLWPVGAQLGKPPQSLPHRSLAASSLALPPAAPTVPTTSINEQDLTGCLPCLWAARGTGDAGAKTQSVSREEPVALTRTQGTQPSTAPRLQLDRQRVTRVLAVGPAS